MMEVVGKPAERLGTIFVLTTIFFGGNPVLALHGLARRLRSPSSKYGWQSRHHAIDLFLPVNSVRR